MKEVLATAFGYCGSCALLVAWGILTAPARAGDDTDQKWPFRASVQAPSGAVRERVFSRVDLDLLTRKTVMYKGEVGCFMLEYYQTKTGQMATTKIIRYSQDGREVSRTVCRQGRITQSCWDDEGRLASKGEFISDGRSILADGVFEFGEGAGGMAARAICDEDRIMEKKSWRLDGQLEHHTASMPKHRTSVSLSLGDDNKRTVNVFYQTGDTVQCVAVDLSGDGIKGVRILRGGDVICSWASHESGTTGQGRGGAVP